MTALLPPAGAVTSAESSLRLATEELDRFDPIRDERLWAARCALEAARLLLTAHSHPGRETLLEAIAATRAASAAATGAALRATDPEETRP
ncbi:hypothetical protein [Amycolatopsis sp. PS_44_ISF1]|uniref:hypothetical protein n=1 Tax=Amycolatopsis sp. PS_44_ISF1 TaxID=2974917 RepID=UPI0028DF1897|nr:hypothetical protein [Amycolatopsis sp. PS_44_ISF1]MDT8912941.1 hypothetical protein [Amycolatopsis sp. PS_44_ISF1]